MVDNPSVIALKLYGFLAKYFADKFYLKKIYKLRLGSTLDLQNPVTFNEKLQWLKLNYRNPDLSKMVDKFEAKNYVAKLIGEEFIIPTLGVWDKFNDIDFDALPNQFVLKTTHDQGGVIICKNKDEFDVNVAKKKINRHLKRNLYHISREWPYKNVQPRIIAEKYMFDGESNDLKDYKFFCFHGSPKLLYVASDRQNKTDGIKFDYFDLDFNRLNIKQAYANSEDEIEKPKSFDSMVRFSKILSEGLPHVRVDFYEINGKVYFGELTFFHHGGFVPFYPEEWDYKLGSYIELPK